MQSIRTLIYIIGTLALVFGHHYDDLFMRTGRAATPTIRADTGPQLQLDSYLPLTHIAPTLEASAPYWLTSQLVEATDERRPAWGVLLCLVLLFFYLLSIHGVPDGFEALQNGMSILSR